MPCNHAACDGHAQAELCRQLSCDNPRRCQADMCTESHMQLHVWLLACLSGAASRSQSFHTRTACVFLHVRSSQSQPVIPYTHCLCLLACQEQPVAASQFLGRGRAACTELENPSEPPPCLHQACVSGTSGLLAINQVDCCNAECAAVRGAQVQHSFAPQFLAPHPLPRLCPTWSLYRVSSTMWWRATTLLAPPCGVQPCHAALCPPRRLM
jgi:hypothetical protein